MASQGVLSQMADMIELKAEIDKLVGRLSGVLGAKTVLDERDEIVEIHVLSDLSRSPKQLVRDIQSALMAAFSLQVDYKLISVAQVSGSMLPEDSGPSETRLAIRRITINMEGQNIETVVALQRGDEIYEGSCNSNFLGRSRLASAAGACAAALQDFLGAAYRVSVLDLQRLTIAGNDCLAVALSLAGRQTESVLYGIAAISSRDTEIRSAVMAVLGALNRPLGRACLDGRDTAGEAN